MTGKNRENYNKNYIAYVHSFDPPTQHFKNCFRAFMVGGLICSIGQFMREMFENVLGLYGDEQSPMLSYQNTEEEGKRIRGGETVLSDGIAYAGIDIVLNLYSEEEILKRLLPLAERRLVKVMIHEQYYYPDYCNYQPDFEEKLDGTFAYLKEAGFCSTFFEDEIAGILASGGEMR